MISAAQVSAQHEKLIKAWVDQEFAHDQVTIFQINEAFVKDSKITIADAIVQPG